MLPIPLAHPPPEISEVINRHARTGRADDRLVDMAIVVGVEDGDAPAALIAATIASSPVRADSAAARPVRAATAATGTGCGRY
jgi:hypothetical protein